MSESISVTDNVFSLDEYGRCSKTILDSSAWRFKGRSNTDDNHSTMFWFMDLMHDSFFTSHMLGRIEALLGRKFILDRVYANGQVYGLDGSFHVDNDDPKAYTFLLYIVPEHITEVNGCTDFLVSNKITSVPPVANRAVFFPSNLMHRGLAPGRFFSYLRITVVWKLRLAN
jgi:hypothetical protein